MALDIADRTHFGRVLGFAARHGHLASLDAKLTWLDTYHGRARSRCVLTPATDAHAFELVMFVKHGTRWRPAFAGRLAFHRAGPPAFAVTITSTRRARTHATAA